MLKTTNYALNKIELKDSPPDITAINPNWDTIDTKLKEAADANAVQVNKDGSVPMDDLTIGTRKTGSSIGTNSFAQGINNEARGGYSHAEGDNTKAVGDRSHAEGYYTEAGAFGHAEGSTSVAGMFGHVEGLTSMAVVGTIYNVTAYDNTAKKITLDSVSGLSVGCLLNIFIPGVKNHLYIPITAINGLVVSLNTSEDISNTNKVVLEVNSGYSAHAEGTYGLATGNASHAEGIGCVASGSFSHAEGNGTKATASHTHAEGSITEAKGDYSHAEGYNSISGGEASHAEGHQTIASGLEAHAEGESTTASAEYSHAEGGLTIASNGSCHAEGWGTVAGVTGTVNINTTISAGYFSHSEGNGTKASGNSSHSEGSGTTASGTASHAEGINTIASGNYSHAEGNTNTASGVGSHTGGVGSVASGAYSTAQGYYVKSQGDIQTVLGKFNTPSSTDLFQVGMGTSDNERRNAFVVTSDGFIKATHFEVNAVTASSYQSIAQAIQDYWNFIVNGKNGKFSIIFNINNGTLYQADLFSAGGTYGSCIAQGYNLVNPLYGRKVADTWTWTGL